MSKAPRQSTKSLWVVAPGQAELRVSALPPLGLNEARVRTLYTAISRGTETLVFHGLVPESEYERMRAPFQEGDFPGPLKYGYINVGLVEQGPPAYVGQTVFSLWPHQDVFHAPVSALTVLPEGVPPERAVLAAGMETALNALWDSELKIGDRALIVGAGVIGALTAYLASRVAATEVLLVDVDASRLGLAEALNIRFATSAPEAFDADVVFHATGHGAGLATALNAAAVEARIVELSWYGDREVSAPLGQGFHSKRLDLRSSQVGRIPASQAARWSYSRRLACALKLLEAPELDALISGESDFADLPTTLAEICSTGHRALCHRVRYPSLTAKEK